MSYAEGKRFRKRAPDGATRRLLEIAEEHPGVFLLKLRPRVRNGKLETAGT